MDRIRNFLRGDSNDGVDTNEDINNNRSNSYPHNTRFNYQKKKRGHDIQDDLYLSDDDDWGMSALSAAQTSLNRNGGYGGDHNDGVVGIDEFEERRRKSGVFWDQASMGGSLEGVEGGFGSKGGGGPNNSALMSSGGGMQEWERAAIYRDNLDDAFEIGNDDYYTSDQRSLEEDNKAYQDVHEDIQHLECEEDHHQDDDETEASREEVVNAYKDYLKSIREGGFESYLNDDDDVNDTPDFSNIAYGDDTNNTPSASNKGSRRDDKVVDIEEERSLYGDLYGVKDMRANNSPYATWREKAKALVEYDDERTGASPRRNGRLGGRLRRSRNNGSMDIESTSSREKDYYRSPLLHSSRFKRLCIGTCLIMAIVIGVSVSVSKKNQDDQTPDELAIPPKSETSQKNDQGSLQSHQPHQPPHEVDAIANALGVFDPQWFDRRSGWEGIKFSDAVNFCSSHENRVPCPYELYCNEGPDRPPYQGTKPSAEQWAAISNGPNQWVSVGSQFTCKRYTELHDNKKPSWGITGISLDHEHGAGGITQNVMCCLDVNHLGAITDWGKQDEIDNAEADASTETAVDSFVNTEDTMGEKEVPSDGNVAVISNNINVQKREKAVIAAFQPIWFSSSHGWSGGSYEDAINFCESYNHMVLCPFAAYCPSGPGHPALPGSMVLDLDGEEWAPANGPMNTWVQIGTMDGDEDTRCTMHHDLLRERPQWGIDGTRTELKHHIMCCLM